MVTNCYKELCSFDANLIDSNGQKLPVDCRVSLPSVWGEMVGVNIAIPHSVMPFNRVDNPCSIDTYCECSDTRMVLKDIWYRQLTISIYPPRNTGATEILITHMESLCLVECMQSLSDKLLVYITASEFFNELFVIEGDNDSPTDLMILDHPKVGCIKLQRYCVKSRLKDSEKFLLSFGYRLEVFLDGIELADDEILEHISPLLDILSILLRQRVLVYGWELIKNNLRTRFWRRPLDPLQTSYVGVEPKCYLVSSQNFQGMINSAIKNYYHISDEKQKSIYYLSYCLCPAIKLRSEERFMALFRGLECLAVKLKFDKVLDDKDKVLIDELNKLAGTFGSNSPDLCDRVKGIIRRISENSLNDKLKFLLKDVRCSDLWSIDGEKGLSGIRNKLAHGGNRGLNHQGLAVSVLHLSIIVERFVFALLGLIIEKHIYEKIRQDEWLRPSYIKSLKEIIYKSNSKQ